MTPRVAASSCLRWPETARSVSRCRRRVPVPRWRHGSVTALSKPWAPASEIWRRCSKKGADVSTIREGAPRRSIGDPCSTGPCRTWSARDAWTRRAPCSTRSWPERATTDGERAPPPVARARLVLIGNTLSVGPTETAQAARPRKRSLPEPSTPPAPSPEVPNDEEVIGAIILASRVMVAIAVRSLAGNPDDVTLPQYRTLVELTFGGPRRLADLAEALRVSPSTATRMCDRLVRKELVSRTRDELDRREVKLAITVLGRTVVTDVIERRRAEVRDLLRAIPVPLRRQLVSSLTLLATAAGEAPELHWGPGWY